MAAPLAALAAFAAVVLVGCRHAADEPPVVEGDLAQAAQRTKDAGTARLNVEVSITSQGVASNVTGDGEVDNESRRSRVRLSLADATGEGEPGPGGGGVETITDGDVAYATSALLDQFFLEQGTGGQTGSWVRRELGPTQREHGLDLGALLYWGAGSPDPTAALDHLLAAGADAEEVGVEDVGEASTTHYRTTVDLAAVPDAVPPGERDALRSAIETLVDPERAGEVPVDAWVDEEGFVRRLHVTYENVRGLDGADATLEHTIEFHDFGADVTVEPPPAGDTVPLEDLGVAP